MTTKAACDLLLLNIGQLVTMADAPEYRPGGAMDDSGPPKLGAAMADIGLLAGAAVAIADGEIIDVGRSETLAQRYEATQTIDAGGALVTPGLVDPHTHPVFARSRADEFELRCGGANYEDIAKAGGGILNSVRRLRAMDEDTLQARTRAIFDGFLAHGTTTIEAKSGYGLDTANELKMLRVLRALDESHPLEIVPTFLGAHEVPAEFRERGPAGADAYLELVIHDMLPQAAGLAEYCDVFCERGVFTAAQAERVLVAGQQAGLPARVHTDEFADIGGIAMAAKIGAKSCEHLHVTTDEGIRLMVQAGIYPVLLPGVPFFLGDRDTAPARAMIAAGLPVALATDYNPGSAHIISQPFVMSLACLHLRMTPAEALAACTVNAACSLDRGERLGRLLPGFDADLVIWDADDYRELPYNVSWNRARTVLKRGGVVAGA